MNKAKINKITHQLAINEIIDKFQFIYGNTLAEDLPEDDPLVQKVKKLIADGKYTLDDFIKHKKTVNRTVKQLILDGYNLIEVVDKTGLSSKEVKRIQKDLDISFRAQFRYHFQSKLITKPDVYVTTIDSINLIFGTRKNQMLEKLGYVNKPVDKAKPIIWANIPDGSIYVLNTTADMYQKEGYFNYKETVISDELVSKIRAEI